MEKKKSLYDALYEIYKDSSQWKYYSGNRGNYSDKDFLSYEFSNLFIQQYFIAGQKSILTESIYRLSPLRQVHTVSTFFLGLYLYKFLKVSSHRKYEPSFKYLWFLTCLYHDFGYIIEDGIDRNWTDEIDYDVYEHLKIPNDLSTYYDVEIIKKYSEHRGNVDHGIEGGRKLYDLLKRNYYEHQERWAEKNRTIPIDDFEYPKGIWFRKRHEKYYAEAALNIMLHNIWFANDLKKAEEYCKADLGRLINKRLKFTYSAALLFVLAFADTIEPIKKAKEIVGNDNVNQYKNPYKILLESIYISTENNKLKLSFERKVSDYPYDNWMQSICDLAIWVDVGIERLGDSVIIDFHADNN